MNLRLIVLLAATVILTPWPAAATVAGPNIVFILADDLGYGDLGCYGHPRIKTPYLDRLAADGTRFMQYYVSHSVCSPSRASAITGQSPSRWHIYAHLAWLDDNARRGMPDWLDSKAPSLPRALQQAGYRTALFGKWHLGGGSGRFFGGKAINSAGAPAVAAYGFDEARTIFGNSPTWSGNRLVGTPHDVYPYKDDAWIASSSELVADAAIDFVGRHTRSHSGRPFLLNVWLHDPHVPLAPTEAMQKPYADLADPGVRAYYAVVTEMDRQIGRLLAKLDALGLRDTTLVIFSSDNGAPACEASNASGKGIGLETDSAGSNGPLRGWKWHLHEGGIRVPFIVRWPRAVPASRTDAVSVLSICDLTPTLARFAGAAMPPGYQSDGIDAGDALRGRPFDRHQPMFWHNPTANRRGPALAVRDGSWKLLMEPDGTLAELYDLGRDAVESRNVAAANPNVVHTLTAKVHVWEQALPKPLKRTFRPEDRSTK